MSRPGAADRLATDARTSCEGVGRGRAPGRGGEELHGLHCRDGTGGGGAEKRRNQREEFGKQQRTPIDTRLVCGGVGQDVGQEQRARDAMEPGHRAQGHQREGNIVVEHGAAAHPD